VIKDNKINERKLDNLFKNFLGYKLKNPNNFYIFDSFGLLCENEKCYIYKKVSDKIIFRDESHLTYEGVSTLQIDFDEFLINQKLVNTK